MSGRPPLVLARELTRACPLACRHCRAAAQTVGEEPDCAYEPSRLLTAMRA